MTLIRLIFAASNLVLLSAFIGQISEICVPIFASGADCVIF